LLSVSPHTIKDNEQKARNLISNVTPPHFQESQVHENTGKIAKDFHTAFGEKNVELMEKYLHADIERSIQKFDTPKNMP
jgi:hypothetical protein